MPVVLEHIDAISRRLGRDVLYIQFIPSAQDRNPSQDFPPVRQQILEWLDQRGIRHAACHEPASDAGFRAWRGHVYLPDALAEEGHPVTDAVNAYLENEDHSSRFPGVTFFCMNLEFAMGNAHRDAPDYEWD